MYNQEDQNGMIRLAITVLLTTAFLVGWQIIFPPVATKKPATMQSEKISDEKITEESASIVKIDKSETVPEQIIKLKNSKISVEISNHGAVIRTAKLIDYKADIIGEEEVTLLGDRGDKIKQYVTIGWTAGSENERMALPNKNTIWNLIGDANETSFQLEHQNKNGQKFIIKGDLDDKYMLHLEQIVSNHSQSTITAEPYSRITRSSAEQVSSESFEGISGVFGENLEEISYKQITKEKVIQKDIKADSWVGISDKYWLTAIIPAEKTSMGRAILDNATGKTIRVNAIGASQSIKPQTQKSFKSMIFLGAKNVDVLDAYSKEHSIKLFDRAIDFGIMYFAAKPVLLLLRWLNKLCNNYGIAIVIMTIMTRFALLPLANKSQRTMDKIKKLTPKMAQLKEQFKENKEQLNKELIDLYRKEAINPLAGILPIVLQIPIFFALYKVLYVSIEMRHSPFIWWIADLAAPDRLSALNLFGLIPIKLPSMLAIGVLPMLMGLTMFIQQKMGSLNLTSDSSQAKMMLYLPLIFTFIFASFPSGLVLYWVVGNLFSIIQQLINKMINRKND